MNYEWLSLNISCKIPPAPLDSNLSGRHGSTKLEGARRPLDGSLRCALDASCWDPLSLGCAFGLLLTGTSQLHGSLADHKKKRYTKIKLTHIKIGIFELCISLSYPLSYGHLDFHVLKSMTLFARQEMEESGDLPPDPEKDAGSLTLGFWELQQCLHWMGFQLVPAGIDAPPKD